MATLRSDVLDISYTDLGDPSAAPVILAHGWPDAARGWREVAEQLAESGWRVLLPDNRGSGATAFRQSETVRDGSGVALAQDILDLADGLGLEKFSVMGNSMGGIAAQDLASRLGDRVSKLILVGTGARIVGVKPDWRRAIDQWIDGGPDRAFTERMVSRRSDAVISPCNITSLPTTIALIVSG